MNATIIAWVLAISSGTTTTVSPVLFQTQRECEMAQSELPEQRIRTTRCVQMEIVKKRQPKVVI